MIYKFFNIFINITVINGQQHLLDDGINCYSCQMPFDKGRKRRVVDNCGHGRCYNCLVTIESCPICIASEKGM